MTNHGKSNTIEQLEITYIPYGAGKTGEVMLGKAQGTGDPAAGRFIQADTDVPGNVQGLDRYAYSYNNPVKYTDPTGHVICSDDGNCEFKTSFTEKTYKILLKNYGITTEGDWTLTALKEAYNGARQVAYALVGAIKNMNSAQAFQYVFGEMDFCSGDCNGIVLGGYYGISSGSTIAFNSPHISGQGVAHELGHSFETRVYDSLGSNVSGAPVNMLAAKGNAIKDIRGRNVSGYDSNAGTYVRTMEGYGNCGLNCSYHPLNMMPEGDTAG